MRQRLTIKHHGERAHNQVVWINPLFRGHLPLALLKSGRRRTDSPLGVFSQPDSKGLKLVQFANKGSPDLCTSSRSAFVASPIVFSDNRGNKYHWLNLKGCGRADLAREGRGIQLYLPGVHVPEYGIFETAYARHARRASQELLKAGVRIVPDLAHIRLHEHRAYESREMTSFPIDATLVVRAFGCRGRVVDIDNRRLLQEAIKVVRKENGYNMSRNDYAEWFAETLADSLATMHSHGWIHGFLTDHNITLDARLNDFDSMSGIGDFKHTNHQEFEAKRQRDVRTAKKTLNGFLDRISPSNRIAYALFDDVYAAKYTVPRIIPKRVR